MIAGLWWQYRARVVASVVACALVVLGIVAVAPTSVASGAVLPVGTPAVAPVPSPGKGAIYGVVTPQAGPDWDGPLSVAVYTGNSLVASVVPDGDGAFQFPDLALHSYRVAYVYGGTHGWTTTYWAPPGQPAGSSFSLTAGSAIDASGVLARASVVSGTVSAPSEFGLTAPTVELRRKGYLAGPYANDKPVATVDPATGAYSIADVGPGVYEVRFRDDSSPVNVMTSWGGPGGETTITIAGGETLTGIDVEFALGGALVGTVVGDDGAGHAVPIPNARVEFSGSGRLTAVSDELGRWVISSKQSTGSMSGTLVAYPDPDGPNVVQTTWQDGGGNATVTVPGGQIVSGVTITMPRGSTLTGAIVDGSGHPPAGVTNVAVRRQGDSPWPSYELDVDSEGRFDGRQMAAGDYLIEFRGPNGMSSYYDGVSVRGQAEILSVGTGVDIDLGDVLYVGGERSIDRIAGSDRYATAVGITQRAFPDGGPIPVVYLANGSGFADALSAGPAAAAHGGALLLIGRDGVPASVMAELHRLDPQRIVLVGATAALSGSVATALNHEFPGRVDRIGGADRYETSRLIVQDAFPAGADQVFVATGRTFPDALAASAAAGLVGAAVVLVDGLSNATPASTRSLLRDLQPSALTVVGGRNAISWDVESGIYAAFQEAGVPDATYSVIAGATRYETALQLAAWYVGYMPTDIVYLASGENFPDALAGGPLAAVSEGTLLLVPRTCVPAAAVQEMNSRDINQITLLGGASALTGRVEALVSC